MDFLAVKTDDLNHRAAKMATDFKSAAYFYFQQYPEEAECRVHRVILDVNLNITAWPGTGRVIQRSEFPDISSADVPTGAMVSAREFEKQVEDMEGICVVLRCAGTTLVPKYSFQRSAPEDMLVKVWRGIRLKAIEGIEVAVISPRYMRDLVTGTMKMGELRDLTAQAVNLKERNNG